MTGATMWLKGERREQRNLQDRIGWNLFFRGFISRHWREEQNRYVRLFRADILASKEGTSQQARWHIALLTFIWTEAHTVWTDRCAFAHRKDEQHRSAQDQIRAQTSVRALYSYAEEVSYFDRSIFSVSLEDRLKQSPRDQFAWVVASMQPAVMAARKSHLIRSTENIRDIRTYFKPLEPRYQGRDPALAQSQASQSNTTGIQDNPT